LNPDWHCVIRTREGRVNDLKFAGVELLCLSYDWSKWIIIRISFWTTHAFIIYVSKDIIDEYVL